MKRTPLYQSHQQLGARLIEFGGWEMPVQYTSIADEHATVRNAAGIFDISHMGEFLLEGEHAVAFLNRCLTNDLRKLAVGEGQYTLLCNDTGGVIDDLYAYRLTPNQFLLIVNASRIDADFQWLRGLQTRFSDLTAFELRDVSSSTGAVAVQGPAVARFIDKCFGAPSRGGAQVAAPTELKKNQIAEFAFGVEKVWVSRTGYTGEDGFEVVAAESLIEAVWKSLIEAGTPYGLKPAGLGARDTLRTEVCYPLYGHELNETTTPIEAGLGFFVALEKGDFVGRSALQGQKVNGLRRKLVAFKMAERSAPPRPDYAVWSTGDPPTQIGRVASGTYSPSLNTGIGLAYVDLPHSKPNTPIAVEARGRKSLAVTVPKPIFRKSVLPPAS